MTKRRATDPKQQALRQQGTLHPHPKAVLDPLFVEGGFFDARDLLQVKYEMLRSVREDRASVLEAAGRFGLSRPTYYQAQAAFERGGLPGLLPARKGPRRAHKLAAEFMAFVADQLRADGTLDSAQLAAKVAARFQVTVHPRSIERALERSKKGPAAK